MRSSIDLSQCRAVVLDEADEMLRMGFIDDVEWVLEHTPDNCQIALFSATMPAVIKKVAQKHLNNPEIIKIESKTSTAQTIRQRYWQVSGVQKLDALTRILESEQFDAIIIFVRTKVSTEELAEKLNARGYSAAPLNGDIQQASREKTVERLKKGQIDILVATDVAARGLDVERISHVINYDIPYDTEAYVHRIGRTGRAGRTGEAILFVAPREKRMLAAIEKATRQAITRMDLPSAKDINKIRIDQFKQGITECIDSQNLTFFQDIIEELQRENELDPLKIAAALAQLGQGDRPFLLDPRADIKTRSGGSRDREKGKARPEKQMKGSREVRPLRNHPEVQLVRYQVDIGYKDGLKPGNLVGAIANTAGLDSEFIGQIEIYGDFSTVDLPQGMPGEVLRTLQSTRVLQKPMSLRPYQDSETGTSPEKFKRKGKPTRRDFKKDSSTKPRKRPAK
jgi:ATP-dependent RNA helicase DeaD